MDQSCPSLFVVSNAETQSSQRNAEKYLNCEPSVILCVLRVSGVRGFYPN